MNNLIFFYKCLSAAERQWAAEHRTAVAAVARTVTVAVAAIRTVAPVAVRAAAIAAIAIALRERAALLTTAALWALASPVLAAQNGREAVANAAADPAAAVGGSAQQLPL